MQYRFLVLIFSLFVSFLNVHAQVDHYETVVFASDDWRHITATQPYPITWMQTDFNDSNWPVGPGGFGYSDGDDGTQVVTTIGVAMRKSFEVVDVDKIESIVLSADYDDGFVAYINGVEFARANLGQVGTPPAWNEATDTDHEANLYLGQQPAYFTQTNIADYLVNGENIIAIQVNNVTIASSDLSSNFWLSFGINDTSSDYEPNPSWFNPPMEFESSNLPLLLINTNGQNIQDDIRITAQLGIIDNGPTDRNYLNDAYNGYDGQISIEYRGASSLFFDKKSYSFETQLADGSNNNVELLGMPSENDWVLSGPYSDKSLMRNMLTYHISRSMGNYASRTVPCELLINGQYEGFYILMERIKIDENRLDIASVNEDDLTGDELTGGYLVQIDRDNGALDDGFYSDFPEYMFYAYDDPDYDQIQPAQKAYIQTYIEEFEVAMDGQGVINWEDWLDADAFVDYVLASEITKQIDAYRLSFFMHKRKDSNGGKLHLGPMWDYNLGYGNFDYACDNGTLGWSYDWNGWCANQAFWLAKIANRSDMQLLMHCRWEELREDVLSDEALLTYIDDMTAHIDEAQERNYERWPVLGQYLWPNGYVGETYEDEVDFLKEWLEARLSWMDGALDGDCSLVSTNEPTPSLVQITSYPNPVEDDFSFSFKSAQIKEAQFKIINILGQPVYTNNLIDNQLITVPMNDYASGIYFFQLIKDGEIIQTGSITKR